MARRLQGAAKLERLCMSEAPLAICDHCDAVYRRRAIARGEIARCQRCDSELYRNRRVDIDLMLALTATSLVVLILANIYPIITVTMQGTQSEPTLWGAILISYDLGVAFVALIAALTVFLFPLMQLLLFLHVLLPLRFGERVGGFKFAMHALRAMQPWSMVEVFVLGALVSVVKLSNLFDVQPRIGFWGFGLLTVLLTVLNSFNLHALWDIAEERAP